MTAERFLPAGAFYAHERFGPNTVNRGAVLWECEWEGGVFAAGVMLGGIFRAGDFRGGILWAAWWRGGVFTGGFWHHGFAPDGSYLPRGAFPGSGTQALAAVSPAGTIEASGPRLTVFAASVFGDVPRIWRACLARSLPANDAVFEIYDDSEDGSLDARELPGVTRLERSPERPDFQVAYGDALRRAKTPFLAFVDTDVFWLSPDAWPRILQEFHDPRVAAVSCLSRADLATPGTFAVILRTETYRAVAEGVPGGFAPFLLGEAPGGVPGRCRGDDTGDRVARAVIEAGFEIRALDLASSNAFVRFDAITMTRLLAGWVREETLLEMAVSNRYFRRGCLGAAALARVHDSVFPEWLPFGRPLRMARLWARLARHPRTAWAAAADAREFRKGARQVLECLRAPQPDRRAASAQTSS